jgi:hypothetical protein
VTTQGYVPPPTTYPAPPSNNAFLPPLPPRLPAGGPPYPTSQPPGQEQKVTGLMYPPIGDDKNSVQLAKYKNMGLWGKAQQLEHQIFQEQQRTLGPENLKALTTGHNLAATYLKLEFVNDATNWATWVASTSQRTLGPKHPLFMKNESLTGEILLKKGLYLEADTHCANILARQQDYLGDDHLDTLETQRRLGLVCKRLGRQQDALVRLQKRSETLERILGGTHIQVVSAALDLIEARIPFLAADTLGIARFSNEVKQAAKLMSPLYQDLRGVLGPQHPLSIRALRVSGTVKSLEGNATEASDTLRRALSNAEEAASIPRRSTSSPRSAYCIASEPTHSVTQNGTARQRCVPGSNATSLGPRGARARTIRKPLRRWECWLGVVCLRWITCRQRSIMSVWWRRMGPRITPRRRRRQRLCCSFVRAISRVC